MCRAVQTKITTNLFTGILSQYKPVFVLGLERIKGVAIC